MKYDDFQLNSSTSWRVEVFFDGDCPLCAKEIRLIRWLDKKKRVQFTDIASPSFSPEEYGKTMKALMDEIHGRLPDGTWILGVEVFRQIYSAIGLGLLVWPTRIFGVRHLLNGMYQLFAKHRLRLTGRCKKGVCDLESDSRKVAT